MSRCRDVAGTRTKVYLQSNVTDVTHRPVFFRIALLPSFPLYSFSRPRRDVSLAVAI